MVDYGSPLGDVLYAIKRTAAVRVVDYKGRGEWFLLKTRLIAEPDLFARMERNWRMIVGGHEKRFALLHVAEGPECGVWVHYFPTLQVANEYLPGCHRLPSWT